MSLDSHRQALYSAGRPCVAILVAYDLRQFGQHLHPFLLLYSFNIIPASGGLMNNKPTKIYSGVSQPLQHCHFGPDSSLCWGCLVHCRMFNSISGIYPVDGGSSSSSFPVVISKIVSRHCLMTQAGKCYMVGWRETE